MKQRVVIYNIICNTCISILKAYLMRIIVVFIGEAIVAHFLFWFVHMYISNRKLTLSFGNIMQYMAPELTVLSKVLIVVEVSFSSSLQVFLIKNLK